MNKDFAEEVCRLLNGGFEKDPQAIHALFSMRVPCNEILAEDANIIVDLAPIKNEYYTLGLLGIINGILTKLGSKWIVAAQWDEQTNKLGKREFLGFVVLEQ